MRRRGVKKVRQVKKWLKLSRLRALFKKREALVNHPQRAWLAQVPEMVRDAAITDFTKAVDSNEAKEDLDGAYDIRFRSKKHLYQESFPIHNRALTWNASSPRQLIIFPSFLGKSQSVLRFAEDLPTFVTETTCRLIRERGTGDWYLSVPLPLNHVYQKSRGPTKSAVSDHRPPKTTMPLAALRERERVGETQKRAIAIDPGVRTMLTGYDPDGRVIEIGSDDDMERLYTILKRADVIQSVLDGGVERAENQGQPTSSSSSARKEPRPRKPADPLNPPNARTLRKKRALARKRAAGDSTRSKKRQHLRRRQARLRKDVQNLKTELHRKAARLLCANYDVILLPHFDTADMAAHEHPDSGKRRVLNNKTVRKMLCWGHYSFKRMLHAKAREAHGQVTVLDVDEAYTSKTCGQCGRLHEKLGGSKVFRSHQER